MHPNLSTALCPKSILNRFSTKSGFRIALSLLFFSSLTSLAAESYTIDFRKLYTGQSPQDITAAELLSYLNSEDGVPGIVSAVPECNLAYGYTNGLKAERAYDVATGSLTDYGALFLRATDSDTKEDDGIVTLRIDPKYRHRNTNLNIYVYLDMLSASSQDLTPQLEVAFNGGDFLKSNFVKRGQNYTGSFNFKPEEEIITDLSIKVPNIYRKEGAELSGAELDYYMAITHINLYYNEEKPEEVIDWYFSESTDTGYLNDETEYAMPTFVAVPAQSEIMMELTSSDPTVAEIINGKVVPKSEGTTTITASLAENSLFKPSASYTPASYELTVKKSTSTAVELTYFKEEEHSILYDLHGRVMTGNVEPGVYIIRTGADTKKVVIK